MDVNDPQPSDLVEADSKRPYKTYATMASVFLSTFVVSGVELPLWAKALILAVVASLAVFITPNPLAFKSEVILSHNENDPRLF